MSEIIDNVSKRQAKLKDLIKRLHNGEDKAKIEAEFKADFAYVTGAEIAEMEHRLVEEEGVDVADIQNLCDIHASIFEGSVQEMHDTVLTVNPLKEFEDFNAELSADLEEMEAFREDFPTDLNLVKAYLGEKLEDLKAVEAHYAKKENVLFPFLEAAGIKTVPQVMWGVHNNIRASLKRAYDILEHSTNIPMIKEYFYATFEMIRDMVTKENNILFPMLRDTLREEQWRQVSAALNKDDVTNYQEPQPSVEGLVNMSAGALTPNEVNAIMNTIPFDMTFVGADNKVKFVTQGKERIFDRPKTIIGRPVELCHPPQSVHVVLDIVEDLRSGKKDHADFWINFRGQFVYIRYFAVRDEKGTYLGVLEVTQNIQPIRELSGEKRLAD